MTAPVLGCRAEEISASWPVVAAGDLVSAPAGTRVWLPSWPVSLSTLAGSPVLYDAPGRDRWVRFTDVREVVWSVRPATPVRVLVPVPPLQVGGAA